MAGWLDGQVAMITGGARGIGAAVVRRYLDEGARVVVLDRDIAPLADLQGAYPGALMTVAGDVRDAASHATAVAAACEAFGRLDILVGNAGIFDFNRPLRSYDPARLSATFDEISAVNVRGYLFAAMAAREVLAQSHGCMIFTGSIAGFHAGCGGIVYTVLKHAVVGLVRQLALELAPDIRVNGVAPGGTLTNLSGAAALGHETRSIADMEAAMEAKIAQSIPLKFAQRPEDHAGLYVLLASRANARAITGEMMMSDGGVGIRPV